MKKTIFAILIGLLLPAFATAADVTSTTDVDGNLVITVTLTPNEQTFLKNDLLTIDDWVLGAIVGKTNKCKSRMVKQWDRKLRADKTVTSIPTDETEWLNKVTAREGYKTRAEREAKLEAEREAELKEPVVVEK